MRDPLAWLRFSLGILVYEPPPAEGGLMAWIRENLSLVAVVLILLIIVAGSFIIYLILTSSPTPTYP